MLKDCSILIQAVFGSVKGFTSAAFRNVIDLIRGALDQIVRWGRYFSAESK